MLHQQSLGVAILQPARHFPHFCQSLHLPLFPSRLQCFGFAVPTTSFLGADVSSVSQFGLCNNYKIPAKYKMDAACVGMARVIGWTRLLPHAQVSLAPIQSNLGTRTAGTAGTKKALSSQWLKSHQHIPDGATACLILYSAPCLSDKSQRWVPPWRRPNTVWICELSCKVMSHTHSRNKMGRSSQHTLRTYRLLFYFCKCAKISSTLTVPPEVWHAVFLLEIISEYPLIIFSLFLISEHV